MEYCKDLWYGPYGGCFIADAFTLACDRYYEAFEAAAADPAFQAEYNALRQAFPQPEPQFSEGGPGGSVVCRVPENYGPLFGTALLAKRLGKQAVCGARYADEAALCAQVCAHLGVKLHLFLGRGLGRIRTLTDRLELLGASYDTKMCAELFDLPEMYAFQAWVSEPEAKHLVNCRSNVGAFPQTNIAAAFAALEAKDLLAKAAQRLGRLDRVVVPSVSGTYALAVAENLPQNCACVCVECDTEPDLAPELDSYCGAFTKVLRNRTADRVLAPRLMKLEEDGKILRVQLSPQEAARAAGGGTLSLQSLAALRYCESQPGEGVTLCLVRSLRWGAAL